MQASTTLRQEGQSLTCSSEVDLRGPESDASVKQLYSKFGFNSLKNTFLQLCWRIRFACLIYRHRREALRAGTQQFTNWRGGISLSLYVSEHLTTASLPLTKHTEPLPIMRAISNTEVSLSQSIGISLSSITSNQEQTCEEQPSHKPTNGLHHSDPFNRFKTLEL